MLLKQLTSCRARRRTSGRMQVRMAWFASDFTEQLVCANTVLLPAALVVSLLNNIKSSWAILAFIAILYGPILWLTVLLHELGHCLATKRVRSAHIDIHA